MKKTALRLGLTFAMLSSARAATDTDLDALFKPWSSAETPGCSVAVARQGMPTQLRAYGSADLEHDIANTPSTLFEVGSISKQFTAASVLMLVEEGKIGLGDDIRKYLPEMPSYGDVVTIEHLLTHTSGLRDWGFVAEIEGWPRTTRAMTNSDVLALVGRQHALNFRPGSDYSYTNTGYVLLAIAVERISGQSLADFTAARIFKPLGMNATRWRRNFREVVKGRSIAYIQTPDGYVQRMPFEDVYGDAGLLTTVGDLLIWNDALTRKRLGEFVSDTMERNAHLSNGHAVTYAHGLVVSRYHGVSEISHGGAIGAYRGWLARYPERGLSIALLCNAGEMEGKGVGLGAQLGHQVADLYLPAAKPQPEMAADIQDTRAHARAGLFASDVTGVPFRLIAVEDKLQTSVGQKLKGLTKDRMLLGADEIIFESDTKFRRLAVDGTEVAFHRVNAVTLTAAEMEAITGTYRNDEVNAVYRLELRDGALVAQLDRRPEFVFRLTPSYRDAFVFDTRFGPGTGLVRIHRGTNGAIESLGFGWVERVRDLRFRRVAAAG